MYVIYIYMYVIYIYMYIYICNIYNIYNMAFQCVSAISALHPCGLLSRGERLILLWAAIEG